MVRIALALSVMAMASGCSSADLDRAVAQINSGPGISVSTRYGGGTLGLNAQRERAEKHLYGWGGRTSGGI
jgi:uncharacterized protein YceK